MSRVSSGGRARWLVLVSMLAGVVIARGAGPERADLVGLDRLGTVKPRRSAEIGSSYWGIQAGSLDERVLVAAAGIGVKWTRLQASWPAIERERGRYDWAATDQAFEATLSHGITPFVDLVGANELYTPVIRYEDRKQAEIYGERPAPPTHSPEAMAAWRRFVEATVTRYRDRIHHWEVWNEPNHRAYWGAPPDARDYGRLLHETATIIKKLAPTAKIIGGATAGMDAAFIDGFLAAGNARLVDVVSYHQYEGEPEARMVRMVKVREVLDRHNPNIETWQGECGYPSASSTRDYRGRAPWGLQIQAKWLLRQAYSDVFLSRSTVSNYFILHSAGRREDRQPRSFLSEPERVLGYFPVRPDGTTDGARARRVGINEKSLLEYPSGTPKPGYYAYRNLCAILDKRYAPVTRTTRVDVLDPGVFYGIGEADDAFPSVPIVATFQRGQGPHQLAYWLPWHGQESLPKLARVRLSVTGVRFADPVLIDLLSGHVFALRGVTLDGDTTVLADLPLADYPFAVAERSEIGIEPARAGTYYVDAMTGRDDAAGTSVETAWRTLERVNATAFEPGDRLLFRAGGSWTGQLRPRGSGAPGRPIVIDRFGEGPRPAIRGDGGEAALYLHNQEHWEIANLELTNDGPGEGLRRGVLIRGENLGRALSHLHLRALDVHHVRGKLGADMVAKTTGGIAFEIRGTDVPTRFDDILVEDCTIRSVDNTGLYTYSDFSPHPRDARWEATRFTGVRIRRNRLSDIGKNAMAIRASLAPVIEHNVIEGAAARLHGNALYVFGCKDALIQFNEVSGTRFERIEGAAFDSDYNSEGTIIQYNYSRDNGGGLVNLCNNPASSPPRGYNDGTIVRYNISQNEVRRVIAFDGPVTNTLVHNNTIYVGPGRSPTIVEFDTFGSMPSYASQARFVNNIVYNAGSGTYAWGGARDVAFRANCFFGTHPQNEPDDPEKVVADPLLAAPGTGGTGLASVGGYQLQAASPCRDSGAMVTSPGERDYWGNPLDDGRPDRGAHEVPRVGLAQPATSPAARYVDPVFADVTTDRDVPLRTVTDARGQATALTLDVYQPAGDREARRPVILWIHGGGFRPGNDKRQGYIVRMAEAFARRGYVSVSTDYRVRERPDADRAGTVRDAVDDGRAALAWIRTRAGDYRIDPERIVVAGGSAGGKTAVNLVAIENAEARAAGRRGIAALVDLWGSPEASYRVAEPDASFPPTLIVHGTADRLVPFAHSEELAGRLRALGVAVELHALPGAPHTPLEQLEGIVATTARFLFPLMTGASR